MWVGGKLGGGVWDVDINWGFLWLLTAMRRLGGGGGLSPGATLSSVSQRLSTCSAAASPAPCFHQSKGDNAALSPSPSGHPYPALPVSLVPDSRRVWAAPRLARS